MVKDWKKEVNSYDLFIQLFSIYIKKKFESLKLADIEHYFNTETLSSDAWKLFVDEDILTFTYDSIDSSKEAILDDLNRCSSYKLSDMVDTKVKFCGWVLDVLSLKSKNKGVQELICKLFLENIKSLLQYYQSDYDTQMYYLRKIAYSEYLLYLDEDKFYKYFIPDAREVLEYLIQKAISSVDLYLEDYERIENTKSFKEAMLAKVDDTPQGLLQGDFRYITDSDTVYKVNNTIYFTECNKNLVFYHDLM